ncbi:MAG: D-amino-acid transaminase [Ignavibacteriaceae bacterium]
MITYFNGAFIPFEDVSVSPFDRGFLFADGVYESIRIYNNKLFKYDEHLTRLKRSLNETQIIYNDLEKLESVIYKLIKKNNVDEEALIYLQITRGSSILRTHSFPEEDIEPTVFISASPFETEKQEQKYGIKVSLQDDMRWMRCDIKSVSLLPIVLANQKAKEAGAEEAILVRDGLITEGTHTNFFAVKDNVIYTAPVSHYILAGITRGVVIELANDLNIHVKEESIKEKDLKTFNECFITSTTKEVTPVVQLDDWIINDGKTGNVTTELQNAFSKLTENC